MVGSIIGKWKRLDLFFFLSSASLARKMEGVNTGIWMCQPNQLYTLLLSNFCKQTDCQKKPVDYPVTFLYLCYRIYVRRVILPITISEDVEVYSSEEKH